MRPPDSVFQPSASFFSDFCEFIHHHCQKYVSLGCPVKGECESITETSNETTPHQIQRKQKEPDYGTSCHGVVWMPSTELLCLSIDKVPPKPKEQSDKENSPSNTL